MSIIKIHSTWNSTCFKFVTASQNDVNNIFKNLCNNKTNLLGGIPANILKLSLESYLPKLIKIINDCFQNGKRLIIYQKETKYVFNKTKKKFNLSFQLFLTKKPRNTKFLT